MRSIELQPSKGIGFDALRAHGRHNGEIPVVNTVFPGEDPGQVYPFPKGDVYLTQLGVRVAEPDSVTMVMKLLPGGAGYPSEKEYLRKIGLLPETASVIEVTPQIHTDNALGYPFTDPAGLLRGEVAIAHSPGRKLYYVSAFSNDQITTMAEELGMATLDRPHSDRTNNKALLRVQKDKYGIRMFDGMVIDTIDDIERLTEKFRGKTMWMKYPTGSGGDLVHRIQSVNSESVLETVEKIREEVMKAFEYGSYDTQGREYWPKDALHPEEFPLVIEIDATEEGRIILNGSNSFTTYNDGRVIVHGFFEQITSDVGEYLGSQPMIDDKEMRSLILEQTFHLARYNTEENGYYGNQGADYFVIQRFDGRKEVRVVELNSRPPISMYAHIVAHRLGFPAWINVNVQLNSGREIRDMSDFFEAIGEDLAYGKETSDGKLQIVPLAFRTIQSRTRERGEETIASPQFKAVLLGQTPQHCRLLQEVLRERGVSPQ
ncbi:MAG: hypothetical protein HYT10_03115 [Candidatus Levybacteria bacterium]|nr:hypothetical protein [Candidatus Levybacteria bacterium]